MKKNRSLFDKIEILVKIFIKRGLYMYGIENYCLMTHFRSSEN